MIDDDDDDVCPLCCEELDLSDQQFYPCKCGYQVCMWCWHRIRETESGLCPACRTPYGDDPHEFSAVDMEEVVKANKEKAKAEKREKERLRAMREQEKRENLANYAPTQLPSTTTNFAAALSSGGLGGTTSFGQFDGSDLISALGSGGGGGGGGFSSSSHNKGPPEPPKDRSTLATMRVIRRNLVYAVGMPPNIATEENLRKPEYFGQYGKISKIVINRNHNPGDPRRASASAYVTFAHKEDTLACVLALDGFYHDGRNIRASFGTSKYCSAFIKTVRCNNPDCTYLHHMGDAEDTFNKQEIQAGYVTSGRDVAARQQQIVEQQAAAVFGAGANIRKKVGGGGPSGTGKESKNPIFPPPTFDEPLPRKTRAQSTILQQRANMIQNGKGGLSAASIVAGGIGSGNAVPPAAHTTLTPLKRGGSMPVSGKPIAADLTPAESMALEEKARKEALALQQKQQQMMQAQKAAKQKQQKQLAQQQKQNSNSQPGSPSHTSTEPGPNGKSMNGVGSPHLGGGISGSNLHNMGSPLLGSSFSGNLGGSSIGGVSIGSELQASTDAVPLTGFGGSGILGGQPLSLSSDDGKGGVIGGASLGGSPLGQPSSNSFGGLGLLSANSSSGGDDKWGSAVGSSSQNNNVFGGSGALWGGGDATSSSNSMPAPIGSSGGGSRSIGGPGMDVGGMSLFGTNQNSYSNGTGGSTALASMLGIQLPTGSGSLRQNSSTGGESSTQAPIGGLNTNNNGGTIGAIGSIGSSKPNSGIIGAPQGGLGGGGIPISGFSSNPGGNNDMALLQSLLPGVNITSGNGQQQDNMQSVGVGGLNAAPQNAGQDQKQRGNIW